MNVRPCLSGLLDMMCFARAAFRTRDLQARASFFEAYSMQLSANPGMAETGVGFVSRFVRLPDGDRAIELMA